MYHHHLCVHLFLILLEVAPSSKKTAMSAIFLDDPSALAWYISDLATNSLLATSSDQVCIHQLGRITSQMPSHMPVQCNPRSELGKLL